MPRPSDTSWSIRATHLADPGVWVWEIIDDVTQQVVETSWSSAWVGYDTAEAAKRAGQVRLVELAQRGRATPRGRTTTQGLRRAAAPAGRARLIIVPRSGVDLYADLKRSFAGDPSAEVILDRRFKDRRGMSHPVDVERRHGDRRSRPDVDAQLSARRSVVIPIPLRPAESVDADGRAVLFLCCAEHVVECGNCHTSYRLRWLMRSASGLSCPRCRFAMTTAISQHTETCPYWLSLGRVLQPASGKAATG